MIQLNRLVTFHKALADPNRVRIVALLKEGPLHGQAIANKLGLKPPTVTHHIKKLRDTGIIYERRDKNTIYIHLDIKKLTYYSEAILKIGADQEMNEEVKVTDQEKLSIVRNFITADGKLKNIPSQRKKKIVILAYLIRGIEHGRKYQEKEINDYIKNYHEDYATIRREWIMNHFMYRENNIYELNPKEMWALQF